MMSIAVFFLNSVTRSRPQIRSKFANIPGVTSLPRDTQPSTVPRPPPRRLDAEDLIGQVVVNGPLNQAAGDGVDGPAGTRMLSLESRVVVAEKSTRALLVEVVRLQAALSTAMKSVDEERTARREMENRMRAAADALTQVGAWIEREERRRQSDDEAAKTLLATAQDAEAAALAAKQEAVKRVEEHANRYQFSLGLCIQ